MMTTMKRLLRKFIVSCVYEGIRLYMYNHRFALHGSIEMQPMTVQQFKKHLNKVFYDNELYVNAYLEAKDPTTE